MRWFVDDCEFRGNKGAQIQDIFLIGGVLVNDENEKKIREIFENIKLEKFGKIKIPIKWNLKGLDKSYHEILLPESDILRERLIKETLDCDYKIIISCIEAYSLDRKKIKEFKGNLHQFVFDNALMRYAKHIQECSISNASIILDWPPRNSSSIFDHVYNRAFIEGKSLIGEEYYSGPLSKLNFDDCLYFTHMINSSLLQLSDLIIGATHEFIECALGIKEKEKNFGYKCFDLFKSKFRGYPSNTIGRGLIISSGNNELKEAVESAIVDL